MMKKIITQWSQSYLIGLAFFYSIIIYLPFLNNSYLAPKLTIYYICTVLILLVELIKVLIFKEKITLHHSFLILFLFLSSQILSWLLSVNPKLSFHGEYLQEGLSLFSVLCYVIITSIYLQLPRNSRQVIRLFIIAATTISSIYVLYQYQIYQTRPVGLDGQPIISALTIAIGILIAFDYYHNTEKNILTNIIAILYIFITTLALYRLDSSSVTFCLIGSLGLGLFIFFMRKNKKTLYLLCGLGLLISFFMISYLLKKEAFSLTQRNREVSSAIQMTQDQSKDFKSIFFGHGQNTALIYFRPYKDPLLNQTAEWQWQVSKIRNNYLETYFTLGLSGILVLLYILSRSLKTALAKNYLPQISLIIFFIVWQLFYYLTPFAYIVLLITVFDLLDTNKKSFISLQLNKILLIGYIILIGYGLQYSFRYIYGEYVFSNNQYTKALDTTPDNYIYKRIAAEDLFNKISTYRTTIPCIKDKICNSVQLFNKYQQAQMIIDQALVLNDRESESWSAKSTLLFFQYYDEGQNDRALLDMSLRAAQTAYTLDPNNPELLDSLGAVYLEKKDYIKAQSYLERAISLKPDFKVAYGHLIEVYKQTGNSEKASQMNKIHQNMVDN